MVVFEIASSFIPLSKAAKFSKVTQADWLQELSNRNILGVLGWGA